MVYINKRKKKGVKKSKNIIISILAITAGVVILMYLLSIMNIPILSNINGSIVSVLYNIKSSVQGVISDGTQYFGSIRDTKQENEQLKGLIEEQKYKLQDMEILLKENETLKEQLKIDEQYSHYEKIYSQVILQSFDNYNKTIVVNKGSKDGVLIKQTVISANGLVGYVSSVSDNTCIVTLITDTSTAISVIVSSINKLALLKGDYMLSQQENLKLVNIPIDTDISVGEKIYTSGLGNYEKGIVIGEIQEVINKKNEIDRYAIVKTSTNFQTLTSVAIIK